MSKFSPAKFLILWVLRDISRESSMCTFDINRKLNELMPIELYIDSSDIEPAIHDMHLRGWITYNRPDIFSDEYEGRHYFLTEKGKAIARKAVARISLTAEAEDSPIYFPALEP